MSKKIKAYITIPRFWPFAFCALGIALSTNVINVFKIGNVNVSIAQFIVVFMFIVLLCEGIKTKCFFRLLKGSLKCWLLLVPISFIFLIISKQLPLAKTYLAGVIELCAVLLIIVVISNKKQFSSNLLSGMVYGLLFNVIISLVAFVKWRLTGRSFNFGAVFGLDSYAYYDYWRFRAQGFFTESSYFVCYVCVTTPIALLIHPVKKINNKILLFLSAISLALSLSGNIVIYVFELILCYTCAVASEGGKKKYNKIVGTTLTALLLSFLLLTIGPSIPFIRDLFDKVLEGFQGANLQDASNNARLVNMQAAIELIKKNIVGYGYNMGAVVMQNFTEVSGAGSTFLRMFLDLGVLGGLLYCLIFYQYSIKNLLGDNKTKYSKAFGIAIIGLFACQVSNGYPFASVLTMTLLGLSNLVEKANYNIEELLL